MDPAALLGRFCSIGADCEFGIAQVKLGCHAIDLLRSTWTPIQSLIELFAGDFYELADPRLIRIDAENAEGHFMAHNDRFTMRWHGWARPDGRSVAEMIETEARRTRRLVDKLLDDIATGARIFVRKADAGERIEDARALHAAMLRHGNPTLLWVDREPGPLEWDGPILYGHVPNPAEIPNHSNVPADDWLALCRNVADSLAAEDVSPCVAPPALLLAPTE